MPVLRLTTILILALTLSVSALAASTAPPPFQARFDLRKGPLTLGEAHLSLERPDDGRYRYRLHTFPVGVARIFYDAEVREVSEGRITASGFRPDRYRYRRTGDHARVVELRFNWSEGWVLNDVADRPWRMSVPDDAMDRVVTPLQLMHDLAVDAPSPLVYRIADGGHLRTYRLRREGEETVRTPLGKFHAVKVVRRAEDGETVTRMWCAPELHYLAVRVEQWEDGEGTVDMVLTRLEGMPLPERLKERATGRVAR